MGKWIKVTSDNEHKLKIAKREAKRHHGVRREWRGGFYGFFSELHILQLTRWFRGNGLKVKELDGPPHTSNGAPTKERRRSLNGGNNNYSNNFSASNKRRRKEDRESSVLVLGTSLADIRSLAFSHSKTEVAFLLDVSTQELNRALLAKNVEPIYFGYRCKRCELSFQGEHALSSYRAHVLFCR